MSYPTAVQMQGTKAEPVQDVEVKRAVSGRPRMRSYHNRVWHELVVLHELTDAEKSTLETHYADNRPEQFPITLQADGSTWNVQYSRKPAFEWIPGGRWRTTVRLVEVV